MLFEDQPLVLIGLVIAVVEGWIRVREPFFRGLNRLLRRRSTTT